MISGPSPPPPLPQENCPSVRVGVCIKVRGSFRVGGKPDNYSKENCPLVRVRVRPPSVRFSSFIYTSNQTPHFSSTNQEGNKRSSLDYKLVELLLHGKTASYINNITNISCVDI